ncbi:MAG: type IV pilus assembly protein PilM, partial [Candidatus Hydrogenedentes bacterium]|nr:type IV pilus assembly protein PilM [Candidatus Hydrogenedentota bacterium]
MAIIKRGRVKRLVLDIGTSAIRICELVPTKAGFQLTHYYQRELNIDPAMEEEDKAERRHEVLRELLKEAKIRTKKTIIAVPGQSVFTRNRPLPPVPEYKVTQIVKYEIQQQIPFSLDQIALDYQVLARTEAGGYDVMMAAIKVEVVEKQLEILRKTRRRIDVVDVSPIAAYNWLRHTGEFGEDGQCVALLDMGATTTDIVIQKDGQFKFTRSLHVGGNDITTAIAANFNMSFEDAERLKREKGFAPTGDAKRDGRGGEVIGHVLERLVGEVNRSFAYFRSQPGGGPVTRVIVTGGGACLKNIIPFLQSQLHIDVRIAQPLAGIAVSPKANEASEHPEQACVVLGLALRCCQNVPIQINLIPPRVLEVARRKEQVFYWVLSLVTFYLILASIIPVTAAKDEEVQAQIKQLRSVLAQYDAELIDKPEATSEFEDIFAGVKSDIESYQQDVTDLDNLRLHRNFFLSYIQAINDARPLGGGIALSSIETVVIGGAENTGAKARAKAAGEVFVEEANTPLGQAQFPGGLGGPGGPGGP